MMPFQKVPMIGKRSTKVRTSTQNKSLLCRRSILVTRTFDVHRHPRPYVWSILERQCRNTFSMFMIHLELYLSLLFLENTIQYNTIRFIHIFHAACLVDCIAVRRRRERTTSMALSGQRKRLALYVHFSNHVRVQMVGRKRSSGSCCCVPACALSNGFAGRRRA